MFKEYKMSYKMLDVDTGIIEVEHELTLINCRKAKAYLNELLNENHAKNVIFYIDAAAYMDSSGIGILFEAKKRVPGKTILVADFPEQLVSNISHIGILQHVQWFKTMKEAIDLLNRGNHVQAIL